MFDIQQWLPTWLGGDVRSADELLAGLGKRLAIQPEFTAAPSAEERSPGLAFELSALPYDHLEAFLERLLASAPQGTEACFAVHARPADPSAAQTSGLLALTHGRPLRELKSYVFLRVAPEQSRELLRELVEMACYVGRVGSRPLSMDEMRALLQPWCVALAESNPRPDVRSSERTVAVLQLRPEPFARHPLQTLAIEPASTVECWSFARLSLVPTPRLERDVARQRLQAHASLNVFRQSSQADEQQTALETALLMGERVAWQQTAVLLAGDRQGVHEALRHHTDQYRQHGFRLDYAGPARVVDLLDSLPWLRESARQARRTARLASMRPLSALVATVPVRQGMSLPPPGFGPERGLLLRDRHGAPLCFDARQPAGNYNTLILGLAGSGCTFVGNAVLGAHLAAGGRAWALRWGSTKVFDDQHGVEHVCLEDAAAFSVNPLGGLATADDFFDALPVLKAWLHALADLEDDNATDRDRAMFESFAEYALHEAWRDAGPDLGLTRVLAALEHLPLDGQALEGQALAARIRKGLHGVSATWFEGRSALDEAARYVSIDTSGLCDKAAQEVLISRTVLALFAIALPRMPSRASMMLLVDEADVLGCCGAARLLELTLRRARWCGAQVVLTDHPFSAESRHQHSHHTAMDEGCAHKLLLHSKAEYEQGWLQRAGNDSAQALRYRTRTTRERSTLVWLHEATGQAELLELELSPAGRLVMGSDFRQHHRYGEARKQGLSPADALAQALTPAVTG